MANNKPVKDDKILNIDLGGIKNENIFTNDEITTDLEKSDRINTEIIKEQSSAPTYKPKTFREQFSLFNGKLYVNINNVWKAFTPDP